MPCDITNSRARAGPARSAIRGVPPAPGVRPTTASTRPKRADSVAQSMSQPSEISRPAVRQRPWTSAIVGIGRASSLRTTGVSEPKEAEGLPSSCTRLKLLTSTPPVKMSPSARQTRARASEPSTSSMQSTSAPQASSPNRLSGGLESTTEATLPSRSSRIGVVVSISAIFTSQFGGHGRDLVRIPGLGNPGQLQRIILVAGHDVDVEMEDGLPRSGPAGVDQVDAVRAEDLLHPLGQALGGQGRRGEIVRPYLEQVGGMDPRNHQGMTRGRRVDVHEGHRALIGIDGLAGDRPGDDSAEETVRLRHRAPEAIPRNANGPPEGGPFAWHLDAACQTVGGGAIAIGALSPVIWRQLKARPFLVFLPFFLLPTLRIAESTVARSTTLVVGGFVSVGFGRVAL